MTQGKAITAQEAIDAIRDSGGFVTTIAERLGCARLTVYRLLAKYATVKQALDDERDKNKDFAEGKLLKAIKEGNMTAIIFYLKTQAKDRGYVERQEIAGSGDGPIQITLGFIDNERLPDFRDD